VAWAVPAPFLLATMAGSGLLLWRYQRTGRRDLAIAAIVMPLFCILRGLANSAVTGLTPHTIDAALLRMDFGVGARFYPWTLAHKPVLWLLFIAYYYALPFGLCVVLAFADDARGMLRACVLAAILALPCYLLWPAVGPVWVGTALAPRNCMPSLHVTWALLAWWYAPRWLRWPSAVLVALTGLATIGLGEHYLIDLVVAVPFTAAVVVIARFRRFALPDPHPQRYRRA